MSEKSLTQPAEPPTALTTERIVSVLRRVLPELMTRYSVKSLAVFGSYARNEQRSSSDLDLLVEFVEPPGLLKFIEIENNLSDLLGVKVDLVMKDALKPRIGARVLSEAIAV